MIKNNMGPFFGQEICPVSGTEVTVKACGPLVFQMISHASLQAELIAKYL